MKTAVEWYCEKSIDILEELRAGKMTFAKWFKEQAVILKQAKEMEREQKIAFAKLHVQKALKAVENEMILSASAVKHWYLPETIK